MRVVGSEGDQIGVLEIRDALARAEERAWICRDCTAGRPACSVASWTGASSGFENQKKAQASRKKQKQIQIKEIKFRPGTDDHDYDVKMRNLRRFIDEGQQGQGNAAIPRPRDGSPGTG